MRVPSFGLWQFRPARSLRYIVQLATKTFSYAVLSFLFCVITYCLWVYVGLLQQILLNLICPTHIYFISQVGTLKFASLPYFFSFFFPLLFLLLPFYSSALSSLFLVVIYFLPLMSLFSSFYAYSSLEFRFIGFSSFSICNPHQNKNYLTNCTNKGEDNFQDCLICKLSLFLLNFLSAFYLVCFPCKLVALDSYAVL